MPLSDPLVRRRALFIAYTFPPVGGAGVQRSTKFVKYLPQFGWDATVLTVSNPSVPVLDASLCRDVPPSTHVVRARTFEPSYVAKQAMAEDAAPSASAAFSASAAAAIGRAIKRFARQVALALLQPDPQMLWNVPAFRAAVRALRATRHEVIVASGPPFSSLLLGAALSQYTRLPLVLDYRDEWDVSHQHWEHRRPGTPFAALQRAMERYALRRASLVIATSPTSAGRLEALCRAAQSRAAVRHIFNGFDPDDFTNETTERRGPPHGNFRIVYTGTLYNLMSPEPLVRAIESLAAAAPALASRVELVIAGRRAPEQERRLARLAGICRLNVREYVSHQEAIALMRSADALCVILSDLPGADRVVPAKLFEYMATGRPILAIAPEGEVWQLLRSHPAAFACRPDDVNALRRWLFEELRVEGRGRASVRVDTSPFDRRLQARHLASLLEGVALAPRTSPSLVERLA